MEEKKNFSPKENPDGFLENLISDPIDFGDFKTEDGEAFVYTAIDMALDRLRPKVAERYVPRLLRVGYSGVKWVAPAVIESVD